MKERLIIKNFGPIKEADLTFGRFNVLIGEQATGKSTVAKLLAVCRYFSYLNSSTGGSDHFREGLWDWGLGDFINDAHTHLEYKCSDYSFVYTNVPVQLKVLNATIEVPGRYEFTLTALTERFKELVLEAEELKSEGKGIPYTFFRTSVAQVMYNPLYLAIERGSSFLSYTTSSVSGPIMNAEKLRQIKNRFYQEVNIEPLKISYRKEGDIPLIKKDEDNTFYQLSESASGYQSTVPIVLAIKSYTNPPEKNERTSVGLTKPKTFIVEEPELNLFPTAQYELMKFLIDKTMNYGNTMLIATHSPYVLSALNNLMNAYQSGQKDPEATEAVISKKYWLNPDNVSAYMLKSDGTCENIVDIEEGMIKSGKIDEVSGILNKSFSELLNIQFDISDA